VEGSDLGGDGGAGLVEGLLEVVMGLEVEPELRGVPEEPREEEGGVGGDRALAEDDLVDAAGRDSGGLRDAVLAEAEGLEELPGEDGAGVDGGEAAGRRLVPPSESLPGSPIVGVNDAPWEFD
jgi:hypothetical protein